MDEQETMVRSTLRVVIARENVRRAESGEPALSQHQIAADTGLPISVVNGLATGRTQRLDFKTLDKLCRYFDVKPGDLLEYVPDATK